MAGKVRDNRTVQQLALAILDAKCADGQTVKGKLEGEASGSGFGDFSTGAAARAKDLLSTLVRLAESPEKKLPLSDNDKAAIREGWCTLFSFRFDDNTGLDDHHILEESLRRPIPAPSRRFRDHVAEVTDGIAEKSRKPFVQTHADEGDTTPSTIESAMSDIETLAKKYHLKVDKEALERW